jgi:hypothetical protein
VGAALEEDTLMATTTDIIVDTRGGEDYDTLRDCAEAMVGFDGTDLSSDPVFPVTTYIDGTPRNGNYSLGPYPLGLRDSSIGDRRRKRHRRKFWFFFKR